MKRTQQGHTRRKRVKQNASEEYASMKKKNAVAIAMKEQPAKKFATAMIIRAAMRNVNQEKGRTMIKNCGVCGKPFEAEGSRKYCSSECRHIAYDGLNKKWNKKKSKLQSEQMKEYSRLKTEKGGSRRKSDGNKRLVAKNEEARALGMSYGKYAAREAAASVKVDINIGGNGDVRDRKST